MDEKTLEYMGERVDKARQIQREIKKMKEKMKVLEGMDTQRDIEIGRGFYLTEETLTFSMFQEIITNTLATLGERIEYLEEQFIQL